MQSWGTRSPWSERDTELEPSLSGVMGMLCAAAGIPREEPIPAPWLALRLGVRVLREGRVARDYHTAGGNYPAGRGVARADGGQLGNAVLSNRYYLADADFLCGLEHDDEGELRRIEDALRNPRWQLSLGRKAFVPAVPVVLPAKDGGGLRTDKKLEDALPSEPPPCSPWDKGRRSPAAPLPTRYVIQCRPGVTSREVRRDQPVADSFQTRRFQLRYVATTFPTLTEGSDA
jgi:CRISPR system Cascade subunit CasD